MTDKKIIEIMEDMKIHAERTDDKELIDACDGAIKAVRDRSKLQETIRAIKERLNDTEM